MFIIVWSLSFHLFVCCHPPTSNRQHQSYDDCLEWRLGGKSIRIALCCVVYNSWAHCNSWAQRCAHTWTVLKSACWFRFRFHFLCAFRFSIFVFFVFVLVFYSCFLTFVVLALLGLVSSVPSQEIGWEERLSHDLFCRMGLKTLITAVEC